MPQKNSVKTYYENAFYHIYNRGVEKREIFVDRSDYVFFLHLLKEALTKPSAGSDPAKIVRKRQNFHGKITLLSYCLMPNHFHFLIKQENPNDITNFIRSISTTYSMFFNKKYDRVGPLFQGKFKAIDIDNENYLLWVSRYIHRNPENFRSYNYSSYDDYLGKRTTGWINTKTLLDIFSPTTSNQAPNYQKFAEDTAEEPIDLNYLLLE